MSAAVPAKSESLVRPSLAELATPTAENLSIQARSALQAKLAEYPQSNKPTSQAGEDNSGVKSQTQSSTKCVVISPLVPGTVSSSASLTPADFTSPSSVPVAAASEDDENPKLNGTEVVEKPDRKKANRVSSESSTSTSESSSSSESDEEKKRKKVVPEVINTPPPVKRKRGRPPKSAQSADSAAQSGKIPKTPKSTPRRRPPPPLVSVTPDVKTSRQRGRGCGNCPGCLRDDCGKCPYCLDKPKFGGPGVKKQRCSLRVCSNFVAAPGVRNPKHLLNLSAATSAAANAKAVEKKSLTTPKMAAVKELDKDKDKSTPTMVPTKEVISATDEPKATPTTPTVVDTMPVASPTKNKKGETRIRCIQCSRERKQTMARSDKFCSQRCILQWLDDNPDKCLEDALTEAMDTAPLPPVTQEEVQKKSFSRVLKNLQIDMALPGTTLAATEEEKSPPPTTNPLSPPTLAPSPKPVPSTTIIRTRKQVGEAMKLQATAASKKTETPSAAGAKRSSQQQPASVKKQKQEFMTAASLPPSLTTMASSTTATKSVSFDLATTTIPVSTVQPISAPPLSRTVQPPSISIVPLDQLTALGTALLNQQKQQKQQKPEQSKIPSGLPSDIRKWSIDQVVAYFQSTSDCKDYADIFREQEVDGTALLLLSHESLVKCLGIKLGRALKIMLHVEELRKQHEVLQYHL